MLLVSHWMIYVLGFLVLVWAVNILTEIDPGRFILFFKLLMTATFFGIFTSWLIAALWVHRRPIVEFPKTKQLFSPYKTWKSFPSDHTMLAMILGLTPALVGAPIYLVVVFLFLALLIGFARVYAGVHYPRDILGGIGFAIFFILTAEWLLSNITQPLYQFITTIL